MSSAKKASNGGRGDVRAGEDGVRRRVRDGGDNQLSLKLERNQATYLKFFSSFIG